MSARLGLGVGLDLPWRGPYGIEGDRVSPRTVRFLQRHAQRFGYLFVSWQPRDKGRPEAASSFSPLDALFSEIPQVPRGLHQTALSLASTRYDRSAIVALTNALARRYGFLWVNEDLGLWSARGRPLPYPQPPPLTEEGILSCARACRDAADGLEIPLLVEFPGFETPPPWLHGDIDAYDAFREIVERSGTLCTLDTGHLLSWRWLSGRTGEDLYGDLGRLPLDRCVEIHCAGAAITRGSLVDAHHGILLAEQIELAERLMARCPNLRVVTWEDPKFDADGVLPAPAQDSLDALSARVARWMSRPAGPTPLAPAALEAGEGSEGVWEDDLAEQFLADSPLGRRLRGQILSRSARGVGKILDLYPNAVRVWCEANPCEDPLDAMLVAFLSSPEGRSWSEFAWAVPGRCVEDAFGRFFARGSREHHIACARVLAVCPDPPFLIPEGWRRAPRGWLTVSGSPPSLYAAIDGRLVQGEITPLLASVLRGERPAEGAVRERLASMGLVS